MNRSLVDRVADAVLYEGYILYPYRPAIKNRQRWTFGGLYPESFCARNEGDASANQTECLVRGDATTILEAFARFLHLTDRLVGEVVEASGEGTEKDEPTFRRVESLQVGEQTIHAWQEAEEREVALGEVTLGELLVRPRRVPFAFPSKRQWEPVRDPSGKMVGVLRREQHALEGSIDAEATQVEEGLFRLTLRIHNCTQLIGPSREDALLRSLVSAHLILGVQGGAFVSLLDPPEDCREAAADCRNVGVWPVLVGLEGQTDAVLSSPIILYDYPQLAPESPGEFFDSTEIDEMLTLRILTLTDDEKRAMAAVDARARGLLERTETLAQEQFLGLHGTIRGLQTVPQEDVSG